MITTTRPTLLILVLSSSERRLRAAIRRGERKGLAPRLVCPFYDLDVAPALDGHPIAFPMDYLDSQAIDGVYQAAFDWQKSFPATRLADGRTVYDWRLDEQQPPTIWSWLYRLYPHVHLRIRLITTILAIVRKESPHSMVIVGEDEAFPWQGELIRRTIARHFPALCDSRRVPAPKRKPKRRTSKSTRHARKPRRRAHKPKRRRRTPKWRHNLRARTWAAAKRILRPPVFTLERWIIRLEQRLGTDRLGRRSAKPPPAEAGALGAAHLRFLSFIPPRHLLLRRPHRPAQAGRADFRYDHASRAINITTNGSKYRCRWWRACPWRVKSSLRLGLRDLQMHGAEILITICNGRFEDQLRIDSSGLRLRSSGLVYALPRAEATIVFSLKVAKSTVLVDGVERFRARARSTPDTRSELSLEIRPESPGGTLSASITEARIIYEALRGVRRPRALRAKRPTPTPPTPPIPVKSAVERELEELDQRSARFSDRFDGHALLLLAGRKGCQWLLSRSRGGWILWDEYIELVPEALLDYCRANNWRLTILYAGEPPAFTRERRSYSERFPDCVDELATHSVRALLFAKHSQLEDRYARAVDELLDDRGFAAAFSYQGVRFSDQISDLAYDNIRTLGLHFLSQVHGWSQVLGRLKPDVVFGGRMEHKPAINLACHACKVPTVTTKLGISEEMLPSVIAVRPDGAFDHASYPDLFLVWGDRQRDYLRRKIPQLRSDIAASGRTRNDSFVNELGHVDTKRILRRLKFAYDDVIVIFGATCRTRYGQLPEAQWGACCMCPREYRRSLESLIELIDAVPRLRIMVKPHPADDVAMIERLIRSIGSPRVSLVTRDMGYHNSELLAVSKLFVSSVSSMFAEAVLSGRVAVNIWTPDVNYLYEQARNDLYGTISVTVKGGDELRDTVRRLLHDEALYTREHQRAVSNLGHLFGDTDGHNARRAVELGCAMVRRPEMSPPTVSVSAGLHARHDRG